MLEVANLPLLELFLYTSVFGSLRLLSCHAWTSQSLLQVRFKWMNVLLFTFTGDPEESLQILETACQCLNISVPRLPEKGTDSQAVKLYVESKKTQFNSSRVSTFYEPPPLQLLPSHLQQGNDGRTGDDNGLYATTSIFYDVSEGSIDVEDEYVLPDEDVVPGVRDGMRQDQCVVNDVD